MGLHASDGSIYFEIELYIKGEPMPTFDFQSKKISIAYKDTNDYLILRLYDLDNMKYNEAVFPQYVEYAMASAYQPSSSQTLVSATIQTDKIYFIFAIINNGFTAVDYQRNIITSSASTYFYTMDHLYSFDSSLTFGVGQ